MRNVCSQGLRALCCLMVLVFLIPRAFAVDFEAGIQTLRYNAGGLAYPTDLLEEVRSDLNNAGAKRIETRNEDHSLRELVRMIRTTQERYIAVDHHIFGWRKEVESFYKANLEALRRGVSITRIFVLLDEVLEDLSQLEGLLSYMDLQQKDGIEVKYALQRDLNQDEAYAPFSLMTAGLSDGRVLARVIALSLRGRQPAKLIITWDPEEVGNQNPFLYFLSSPHVHPYDHNAKQNLLKLSTRR